MATLFALVGFTGEKMIECIEGRSGFRPFHNHLELLPTRDIKGQ